MSRLVACAMALGVAATAMAESDVGSPWMGISYKEGRGPAGLQLVQVYDQTPAADAGLLPGDELLDFAGVPLIGGQSLRPLVERRHAGERVGLIVQRDGRRFAVSVVLGVKPSDAEILHAQLVDKPAPEMIATAVPTTATGVAPSEEIDLAALRGRVALVIFVPLSCDACATALNRVADAVAGRRHLSLLAVAPGAPSSVALFRQRLGVTMPMAADEGGHSVGRFTLAMAVFAQANTVAAVVVDHRGVVRYASILSPSGPLDDLEMAVDRAVRVRDRLR